MTEIENSETTIQALEERVTRIEESIQFLLDTLKIKDQNSLAQRKLFLKSLNEMLCTIDGVYASYFFWDFEDEIVLRVKIIFNNQFSIEEELLLREQLSDVELKFHPEILLNTIVLYMPSSEVENYFKQTEYKLLFNLEM